MSRATPVADSPPPLARRTAGQPAWEVARLFPDQGDWTEAEYLGLNTNRLVEFDDGWIEVLPLPTQLHQDIAALMYRLLFAFVTGRKLGKVLFAPLRVRVRPGKHREPDVVFMAAANAHRRHNEYWDGADLVVEVVSDDPDDRRRDLEVKLAEYAAAGIPEYWVIDPLLRTVSVLTLSGTAYAVAGAFAPGETAASVLLPGFTVAVDDVFAAE